MPDYPPSIHEAIDRLHEEGSIPEHVAIIMDGNGRWAREHDASIPEGHQEGVMSARAIADLCGEIESIKILTLYAFSTENWARPDPEIQALMRLLKEFLRREVERMIEQNVRFNTIGDTSKFPDNVKEELQRTRDLTQNNDEFLLLLALNYGSRNEMSRAVREISEDVRDGDLEPSQIDGELIDQYLDTAGLPAPDLLIRTSGEKRLSNFLLWQSAYSEIYFTDTLWPDFKEEEFLEALFDYQSRERRFGKRVQS